MLILNEIAVALTTSTEPVIKQIYDIEGKNLVAIGLRKGVELKEHVALSRAKLTVIQGEINFNIRAETLRFRSFDSYDIPTNVKHSVVGVSDAVFLVLLGNPKEN